MSEYTPAEWDEVERGPRASETGRRIPFKAWVPNYKFGYVAAAVGLVLCAGVLVWALLGGSVAPLTLVFSGLVALNSAVMLFLMPRWAVDAKEDQAYKELRARNRREYRDFKRR